MIGLELKGFKGLKDLESLINIPTLDKVSNQNLQYLAINVLVPGKYQPRKQIIDESLVELADSVKSQGIIQPLIVRQLGTEQYEIIAGERRWRAAKKAGLSEVPVIIRNMEDSSALAFALIENIQRENLNPIEEAYAFARLRDEFSMSHAAIAEIVGRSRVAVTNILRLLLLEKTVKSWLQEKKLEMGHARALLTLESEQQLMLAKKIIKRNLTVRETEKLVATIRTAKKVNKKIDNQINNNSKRWSKKLTEKFSSKVEVKLNNNGTGKIVIHVKSADEINWLVEHIKINK